MRIRIRCLAWGFAVLLGIQCCVAGAAAADNQEIIWNYFKDQGFTDAAAAGILGNLESESLCDPENLENSANRKSGVTDQQFTQWVDDGTIDRDEFVWSDVYGVYSNRTYGYGLAQWTYWSRKQALYDFVQEQGSSIGDLTAQLDFMMQEIRSFKLTDFLRETRDVASACVRFHDRYEGSSGSARQFAARIARARDIFDRFGDPDSVIAPVRFPQKESYTAGQFSDVAGGAWYAESVASACRLGLMKGTKDGTFSPGGTVSLAEAVTMAARIHSIYTTGGETFVQGTPWYQVYEDYAAKNGILIGSYDAARMKAPSSRAEFACLFARALPEEGLYPINEIRDNAIPDVPVTASYGAFVYRLYRAGVLVGSDAKGTFLPQSGISRSEAAAIVTRMADSDQRQFHSMT